MSSRADRKRKRRQSAAKKPMRFVIVDDVAPFAPPRGMTKEQVALVNRMLYKTSMSSRAVGVVPTDPSRCSCSGDDQ